MSGRLKQLSMQEKKRKNEPAPGVPERTERYAKKPKRSADDEGEKLRVRSGSVH